ncbi:hypothetical protein LSAT2_007091, partial [Lamellibrachia satsuma]
RVWGHWWWCPGTRLSVSRDALSVSGHTCAGDMSVSVSGDTFVCVWGHVCPCMVTRLSVSENTFVHAWGHACPCLGTRKPLA